jgi:hypothetical protein
MNTLVVGAGALGGVITGRLLDAGVEVALATRDRASADRVLTSGVRITGVGGDVMVDVTTRASPSISSSWPPKVRRPSNLLRSWSLCLRGAERCCPSRMVASLNF